MNSKAGGANGAPCSALAGPLSEAAGRTTADRAAIFTDAARPALARALARARAYARLRILDTSAVELSVCWPRSIASAKLAVNSLAVPSEFGRTQSTITNVSSKLFCTGVPVSASRRQVRTCLNAFESCVFSFLSLCASSTTTRSAPKSASSIACTSASDHVPPPIRSQSDLPSSPFDSRSLRVSFASFASSSTPPSGAEAAAPFVAFCFASRSRCLRNLPHGQGARVCGGHVARRGGEPQAPAHARSFALARARVRSRERLVSGARAVEP